MLNRACRASTALLKRMVKKLVHCGGWPAVPGKSVIDVRDIRQSDGEWYALGWVRDVCGVDEALN